MLLVQVADLAQPHQIISDFATWAQCFTLYMAVLAKNQPSRVMAYLTIIAKVSTKYKWPS